MSSKAQNLSKLAASLPEGGVVPVALTTLTITDSSYVALPDLAVRPAGGYVKIIGANFAAGCVLYVNGAPATTTTFISSTEVRAELPALAVGIYSLMLFNAASAAAIWASGILYSAAPVWGTTAYSNTGNVISTQLLATGDSILTYSLASGTLPAGVTLSSTGLLSGTASGITSSTTVTFTVSVADAQNQANPQLLSLSLTFYVGKLWATGGNSLGQLGLGDIVNRSFMTQVGSAIDWKTTSSYNSSFSIKTDGTLWAWGGNSYGTLGDNTKVNKSSPIQIGLLTNWKYIVSGTGITSAIKTDGTLWAWGSTRGNSSPVQIGTLTTWKTTSCGQAHVLATKTDGTLWGYGDNTYGQLGIGSTVNTGSPTQVGVLTTWLSIAAGYYHSIGIKTDGSLSTWGRNQYNQLGDNSINDQSLPVQIISSGCKIAAGGRYNTFVVKTDGTVWGWGHNGYGQIGDSTTTRRTTPYQIGALTTWNILSSSWISTAVIKTDGTLWTWGMNSLGRLGLGTASGYINSPNQVGSLTTWQSVAMGGTNLLAISS